MWATIAVWAGRPTRPWGGGSFDALGPERAAELVDFLESPADGAYLLVRDESGLLSERSISERPTRRRHSA